MAEDQEPAQPEDESVDNGLATVSFFIGLSGILIAGILGILGMAFGLAALAQIRRSSVKQTGRGLAIAGLVLSTLQTAAIVAFTSFYFTITDRVVTTRDVYAPVYESELRKPRGMPPRPLHTVGKLYVKGDLAFVNEPYEGIHVMRLRGAEVPEQLMYIEIGGNVDLAIRGEILYADNWIDLVAIDIGRLDGVTETARVPGILQPVVQDPSSTSWHTRSERADDSLGKVIAWRRVGTEKYTYRNGGCFPAGTLVSTPDGQKDIEALAPGDDVLSYSLASGSWVTGRVRARRETAHVGRLITIHTRKGSIQTTESHLFFVSPLNDGRPAVWRRADELETGSLLLSRSDGPVEVVEVQSSGHLGRVYTIEVEGLSNFAVGDSGILVHNKGQAEEAEGAGDTGTGGSLARFTIVDDYLYILDGSHMRLFDISTPSKPTPAETVEVGWDIETIFPYKDLIFIGGMEGMYIFDNSDPAHPRQISRFAHVTSCDPVVVAGDYAYVTLRGGNRCRGGKNQLEVVDISSLENPKLAAVLLMHEPRGLGIIGSFLFVCDSDDGLKILDVSQPESPKLLMWVEGMYPLDVIPLSGQVLVTARDGLYGVGGFGQDPVLWHIPLEDLP